MNFSLSTPIERQATLAAITAYIEVLDGVRVQPIDNPAAGYIHSAKLEYATLLAEQQPAPEAPPVVAAQVFGMVTTPMPQFPVQTVEQKSMGPLQTLVHNAIDAIVTTPPAPPAGDLDINGVAWNADTHSSTRTKNKDGSWRVKRNTGAAEVPPAPPVVAAAAPAPVAPPAPPVAAVAPPAPAPVAPSAGPTTFKELMDRLGPLMQSGKLNFQAVSQACQLNGVAALPALNMPANSETIPAVWATLEGMM